MAKKFLRMRGTEFPITNQAKRRQKMSKQQKLFSKRFCFKLGFILLVILSFVYCHEIVHVQIFRYFGVPAVIWIDFVGFHTMPLAPLPVEYFGQIQFLHALNEIIGYQIILPFSLLLGIWIAKN